MRLMLVVAIALLPFGNLLRNRPAADFADLEATVEKLQRAGEVQGNPEWLATEGCTMPIDCAFEKEVKERLRKGPIRLDEAD